MNAVNIAMPSVQSLLIQMSFGSQPLATGTGFVVQAKAGPMLMTNRHNLTGRNPHSGQSLSPTGGIPDRIAVWHNQKGKLGNWVLREEALIDAEGNCLWHEHPTLRAGADFVALPLTQLEDVELFSYDPSTPGADIAVGPAEVVSVIGFPFGLSGGGRLGIWATGFVASEPDLPEPTFYIDCRSRPGQSGSAVIAYRGGGGVAMKDGGTGMFSGPVSRFLGIYSGRINAESDLGIVWKASAIAELVASL